LPHRPMHELCIQFMCDSEAFARFTRYEQSYQSALCTSFLSSSCQGYVTLCPGSSAHQQAHQSKLTVLKCCTHTSRSSTTQGRASSLSRVLAKEAAAPSRSKRAAEPAAPRSKMLPASTPRRTSSSLQGNPFDALREAKMSMDDPECFKKLGK